MKYFQLILKIRFIFFKLFYMLDYYIIKYLEYRFNLFFYIQIQFFKRKNVQFF